MSGLIHRMKRRYASIPKQVRAAFWFLICSFLQKGISNLSTPIFTRLLSTEEYGNYETFNSWLSILTIFISLHLYSGVYTRGLVKFEDDSNVYSSSLQGLTIILCVCWTLVYLVLRDFWNNLFGLTTIQMNSMIVMIWSTSVFCFWAAEQRVKYEYRKLVIITLIVSIAKPVVGVIFVILADDKVTARILGLVLVEIVCYSGLFIAHMIKGKVFYSKKYWKHALLFNIPLIPHYLSISVLSSSDRIMIRDMVGASEAGIYSLAYSISRIMILFNTALTNTMTPWIYKKIKNEKIEDLNRVCVVSMTLIAAVNLLLIIFAPEVIRVFAPKSYSEAIYVIPPVAMSTFFAFSYNIFATFEFYFEKNKFIMIASCISAVVNIILNYFAIPIFGYIAAAYTTLLCYLIYAIAHYYMMNKICRKEFDNRVPFDTKIIVLISSAFMLTGFMFMGTYKHLYVRIAIILLVAVAAIINYKHILSTVKSYYTNIARRKE